MQLIATDVIGDGTHPTTATCLALLDAAVERGERVLDVVEMVDGWLTALLRR